MNKVPGGPPNDGDERNLRRLPVRAVPGQEGRAVAANNGAHLALALEDPTLDPSLLSEGDEFDLRRLWMIALKRRWTVLSFAAIVFVAVGTGTLLMTPIYRSSATLKIDREAIKVMTVQEVLPAESPGDRDFYETQYELLRSRTLALRVVKDLGLAQNPVMRKMATPRSWTSWLSFGERAVQKTPLASAGAAVPPPPRDPAAVDPDKAYIGIVLKHLSIQPVRNSRLVKVSFDSPDPKLSAQVVNAVSDVFIKANLERRTDASVYAKSFLEDRLQQTKLKLEDSERQLVEFAQKEQIVNVDQRESLVSKNLDDMNSALMTAEQERIASEARVQQLVGAGIFGLPEVLESKMIQSLRERKATLESQYQEKLSVYKPAFPAMAQLRDQIVEVSRQIDVELVSIRWAIEGKYRSGLARERLIKQRMGELRDEVLSLQQRSIQYKILKREVDTNRELYDGLLQRYKEIGVAGGTGSNNVSVVDRAEPGYQFQPVLKNNLSYALILGLVGGLLLAVLFEHMDDSIKSPEDVEAQLKIALVGIIPKLRSGTPRQAIMDVRSAFSEAYRSVRTALQFSTAEGVPKVLFVTSSGATEGKSTTAYTLAVNFAQLGKRVLLIDADLRNPSAHAMVDVQNSKGLSNFLAGKAKPSEILLPTSTQGLLFIPTGPLPPNPAELLAGPKMMSLLSLAAEKFDQVIVDGPPVLGLADSVILASLASGTLLVVESGGMRVGYAKGSIKRLRAARARIVGAVLTKYDAKQQGYGYGYGYGSGYGYGYEYGESSAHKVVALAQNKQSRAQGGP